jgi:two-component system sensor histidine kinase PilS (NtrC family)
MAVSPFNTPFNLIAERPTDTWKPLAYLNLYRLLVSATFIIFYLNETLSIPLKGYAPKLFISVISFYFIFSLINWLMIRLRQPGFNVQVYLGVFIDIIVTTLFMHAAGGIHSGFGTLMVVAIGGGSIVMGRRTALLFAATATIAILTEQIYVSLLIQYEDANYIQAGILGLSYFTTAFVVNFLAHRIRESEALARKRGVDLANMAELTEHIIQRMQTGILVIDQDNHVRLMNEAAWQMLGMPSSSHVYTLQDISPELQKQIEQWRGDTEWRSLVFRPTQNSGDIMPRFSQIGRDVSSGILVYLEDTSAMAQRAQQLQLASLGRLTASIAHEIRNPLGAISHAGQLLAESPNLDSHDQRLTRIIADQSQRLNTIVENIMHVSRRDESHIEVFTLNDFLKRFMKNYLAGKDDVAADDIKVSIVPEDTQVRFDPSHLEQVLVNLVDNGLRHCTNPTQKPRVELLGGTSETSNRPFLDIIDHGSGITPEALQHIFEPFFTTEATGSGLGLYLSRELAECNQARLNHIALPMGKGTCFRILFQDPRRQFS